MIITIDGPNSVGKGTLAARLADCYGFAYFDTGMVYRATYVEMYLQNLNFDDDTSAEKVAKNLTFDRMMELSKHPEFRGVKSGVNTAKIASYPKVRAALLKMQQDYAKLTKGVIYDGRDTGTVVCPNADVKFFITASSEVRATRRYKEFLSKGLTVSYEEVLDDVKARDIKDSTREVAPMIPAKDAIIIDTSDLNADEVFEKVKSIIDEKMED